MLRISSWMSSCQPREVGGALLARAFLGPGFDAPIVALHDADEVEQLAAAQKIVDHMAAGADPVDADVAGKRGGSLSTGIRPRHAMQPVKLVGLPPKSWLRMRRMHAVGADQRVAASCVRRSRDEA